VYDIVVLGGGPGGYAAALYAHNFGLETAIVSNERFGGTCLLRGCIPAKQWLHIADVFTTVRHASEYGVLAGEPQIDWEAALARKNQVVDVTVKGVTGLLKQRGVAMVEGFGRVEGPGRVVVDGADGQTSLEGRTIILATGSHPRSIPGYDIDGTRIVSSDHALDWTSRPDRVAIIGGGVIGCEFASMLVDLGAEVHVFEVMDQIVPGADPDAVKVLERQLSRRGVKFHTGTAVGPPTISEDSVVVPFGESSVTCDVVLVAVGRGPSTDGVGIESTKAEVERGFVRVDFSTMQTAEAGVYAVGDVVAGTPQLAHVGFAEAIAAVTHIATQETAPVDYRAIPRVTYTHPEIAEVGLTEPQAKEAGLDVETHTHFFNGVARARIIGEAQGIVKVIAQKDGPIVGASIVGPQAGEMIHELMYAIGWEALPSEAAAFIHAHPTLSEGIGETLLAAAGRSLH
jgi:dihydrolipoamide dehydrogenase